MFKSTLRSCLFGIAVIPFLFVPDLANAQTQEEQEQSYQEFLQQLRPLLQEGEVAKARQILNDAIEGADTKTVIRFQGLRPQIANQLMRMGEMEEALEEYRIACEYCLEHFDDPAAQTLFTTNAQMMYSLARRISKVDAPLKMIERAVVLLDQAQATNHEERSVDLNLPRLLNVISVSTELDATQRTWLAEVIDRHLNRVSADYQENPDDESGLLAYSSTLQAAQNLPDQESADRAVIREQRTQLLTDAIVRKPESMLIANEFGQMTQQTLASMMRDDPEGAKALLDRSVALLEQANERQDSRLTQLVTTLQRFEARIESELKLREMIGQAAPEFEIEAWVNNDAEATLESLDGKVILLDFWAVWCGPCIATFPHLQEWREAFHNRGFEIIGVTRYYNYVWDEETERAQRAAEGIVVTPDDEQLMIGKFMQSYELKHPCIVTPADSNMQSNYGVTGIPHAVLIDRKGNIRMVKVGSGEANAKALHEMIETLLDEE